MLAQFDAVFLGVGLGRTMPLGIEGEDLPGVWEALDFIFQTHTKPLAECEVGRQVLVIGAGVVGLAIGLAYNAQLDAAYRSEAAARAEAQQALRRAEQAQQAEEAQRRRAEEELRFARQLAEVIAAGGSVLVPVFALGKTQEVLGMLLRFFEQALIPALITATIESIRTGKPARCFKDFSYRTRDSWSRERRVIGKAEVTGGEANPRFVVTSLQRSEAGARHLYEKIYCARGDMENRIKECQLDLFADRTSTATMQANQLRLWFASMAYVLLCALRRIGLAHTQFAEATCGTIRLKLLKLGALVRVSVRRIKIAMASACPWQDEFALAHARLRNAIA